MRIQHSLNIGEKNISAVIGLSLKENKIRHQVKAHNYVDGIPRG
jgi:hypothetical protein